jgi:hypothetical protein
MNVFRQSKKKVIANWEIIEIVAELVTEVNELVRVLLNASFELDVPVVLLKTSEMIESFEV